MKSSNKIQDWFWENGYYDTNKRSYCVDLKRCDQGIARDIFSEIVEYSPETGEMVLKYRERNWFISDATHKRWNSRFAGKIAGSISHYGYRTFGAFGMTYQVSRVAWLFIHGKWPDHDIDHIDGDRTNNKIENLREATRQENNRNQYKTRGDVPLKGVSKYKHKYRAHIAIDQKQIHLGYFDDIESAHAAYKKAAQEYFGEFWNPGNGSI